MAASAAAPVRWGILSTARIAAKVCAAIHAADGAEARVVASRDLARARRWAAEHGVPRACGSYGELLEDPDLDAVYVATPPSLHAEWTIRAAEAGKHVLCEKPLAASLGEARAMAAACVRHGVQLMDGVMWLHQERTAAMRRHLDDGELGDLRRLTAAFTLLWDPLPAGDIRFRRELAGGALGDLGWYCVGAALWAFGELPQRVWATARTFRDVESNASALLWFAGDRVASFDCGYDTVRRKWMEIAGTAGSLVCDDFVRPDEPERARYWLHDADGRADQRVVPSGLQERRMIERFSAIVGSGELDDRWPVLALEVQRVVDALVASARGAGPVELPA